MLKTPRNNVDFAVPVDYRINLKESEKKDKYLDLARELKKLWNMKVTIVSIGIGAHNNKRIIKRPGGLRSWRTGRDYPYDSIVKNGQNAETSPGDLRRLSANTDVKNSKQVNNDNNNERMWKEGQVPRPC